MKIFRKFDELETLKDWERKLRREEQDLEKVPVECPYCSGREVVKRGVREKKFERVQLYLCKACDKTFTRQKTRRIQEGLKTGMMRRFYWRTPWPIAAGWQSTWIS